MCWRRPRMRRRQNYPLALGRLPTGIPGRSAWSCSNTLLGDGTEHKPLSYTCIVWRSQTPAGSEAGIIALLPYVQFDFVRG